MKLVTLTIVLAAARFGFAADLPAPATVAVFEGEISDETVDKFLSKYGDRDDLVELSVASQGGNASAALRFARWIRAKRLDVRVQMICFSGCANYLFIAGEKKIITSGAFVGWHGDVEQKDFRELVSQYGKLLTKQATRSQLNAEERSFLSENKIKYDALTKLQREQAEFYRGVGIDPRVGRFGQEPVAYPSDGWSFTLPAMKALGIKNVIADDDYGHDRYFVRSSPIAAIINRGPLLVFDSKDGIHIEPITSFYKTLKR